MENLLTRIRILCKLKLTRKSLSFPPDLGIQIRLRDPTSNLAQATMVSSANTCLFPYLYICFHLQCLLPHQSSQALHYKTATPACTISSLPAEDEISCKCRCDDSADLLHGKTCCRFVRFATIRLDIRLSR